MSDRAAVTPTEAWAVVESLALGNPPWVVAHPPLQAIAEAVLDLRRHVEALTPAADR